MNVAHAQINVFFVISLNSYFSNSYGEECPILHCSTLHCFFLEYPPKIEYTITVGRYHVVSGICCHHFWRCRQCVHLDLWYQLTKLHFHHHRILKSNLMLYNIFFEAVPFKGAINQWKGYVSIILILWLAFVQWNKLILVNFFT